VDFIECLDEVGSLSCLVSIFVYIAYLRLELISAVIFVCCVLATEVTPGLQQEQSPTPISFLCHVVFNG
jgi:hypothetical protein